MQVTKAITLTLFAFPAFGQTAPPTNPPPPKQCNAFPMCAIETGSKTASPSPTPKDPGLVINGITKDRFELQRAFKF